MRVGTLQVPGRIEGGDEEVKTDKEEELELGIKDLFSKELWLITIVMWLIWPISELSYLHNYFKKTCLGNSPEKIWSKKKSRDRS